MQLLVLRRRSQLLILVLLLVHQNRLDHLLFLVLGHLLCHQDLLLVLGQMLGQMLCLPLGLGRMLLHLLVRRRRHLLVLVRQMRHLLVRQMRHLLNLIRQINHQLVL